MTKWKIVLFHPRSPKMGVGVGGWTCYRTNNYQSTLVPGATEFSHIRFFDELFAAYDFSPFAYTQRFSGEGHTDKTVHTVLAFRAIIRSGPLTREYVFHKQVCGVFRRAGHHPTAQKDIFCSDNTVKALDLVALDYISDLSRKVRSYGEGGPE